MSKYTEKALALREPTPRLNCCETMLLTFADRTGMSGETARALGANFGHGMKTGGACGAVTGALMVLGLLGVSDPAAITGLQKRMAEKHETLNCAELMRGCNERGEVRLDFCNGLICEAIALIEEYAAQALEK